MSVYTTEITLVEYHGSIEAYHGMYFVDMDATLVANDGRFVLVQKRRNTGDVVLRQVRRQSFTVVSTTNPIIAANEDNLRAAQPRM